LLQVVLLGHIPYQVIFSDNTLGEVRYPFDDSLGERYIVLPTIATQLPNSWEHEKVHACMHAHSHHYASRVEMEKHLEEQAYSEEELVVILSPCLLEANKVDLRKLLKGQKK
jgi:hypothetical protein